MDWGLAKVRRPRLRHGNTVLNQNEGDDSREPGFGSSARSLQIAMVDSRHKSLFIFKIVFATLQAPFWIDFDIQGGWFKCPG